MRITSNEQIVVGTMMKVNTMLITISDHLGVVKVFIVDDLGLPIECLDNDLLSIRLQVHVLDE